MIRYRFIILLFVVSLLIAPSCLRAQPSHESIRKTLLFDFDWRFYKGGALGAEQPAFDDAGWRKIDLPHDWSIEDLPGTSSPFDPDAVGQVGTGFTVGGTGWYRKRFMIPAEQKGNRVQIQFDGVYMNADLWVNGNHLGNHPYGYTSFWYDISDVVKFGEDNVIAVQVKNEGQNSRWYSGSGIYRHVWLKTLGPVHFEPWGISITTPEVNPSSARVSIKTSVRNTTTKTSSARLTTRILNSKGVESGRIESQQNLQPGTKVEIDQTGAIQSPEFWSAESPALYTAISELFVGDQLMDREVTKFGVRTISFDAVKGFQLNGKSVELKGGCVHHDHGPLGAKSYDRAEERKVELLKASGFNAVRCSHNPPAPAFLEACDRLGMLAIDETFDMWIDGNNAFDYHLYFKSWWQRDVESMVFRDRNHPSIIMWSIGNEIHSVESPEVVNLAHQLGDYVRTLDVTRPVTAAVNGVNEKKDPFFSALDIAGYNYSRSQYVTDHQRRPERIMFCTESYPLEAFEYWTDVQDHAWVIGDFVWTAFDYIGESSIGWRGYMQSKDFYPWTLAFCGDIDICGWKRPQSYYRDVLWNKEATLSLFVKPPEPSFPVNPKRESWSIWHWQDAVSDWNWEGYEHKPVEVTVYSSCESVELFLNGKSLGRKPTGNSTQFMASWDVPYQPGTLKAIGFNGKKKMKETELRSAAAPSQIKLTADQTAIPADGQSLSYVTVDLVDGSGMRHPKKDLVVKFEITGPGSMVGSANSNPMSTESFQQHQHKTWQGRCLVIVKSDRQAGGIRIKVFADGIQPAEVLIKTETVK